MCLGMSCPTFAEPYKREEICTSRHGASNAIPVNIRPSCQSTGDFVSCACNTTVRFLDPSSNRRQIRSSNLTSPRKLRWSLYPNVQLRVPYFTGSKPRGRNVPCTTQRMCGTVVQRYVVPCVWTSSRRSPHTYTRDDADRQLVDHW